MSQDLVGEKGETVFIGGPVVSEPVRWNELVVIESLQRAPSERDTITLLIEQIKGNDS